MKFSATVSLQYDTIFSSFSHEEYLKGLDWMQQSCLDGAELCISSYSDIDLGRVKAELDGLMRGLGSLETMDRDLADLSEAMKPLVAYADQKGVTLCLEAINRYETALLNSAEATMDFIVNDLGNPDCVGILWDLFHANIEDIGFKRSIDIMGGKLQHVHLADSNRMFPGYGHTDFAGVLKAVKDSGYSQYCSFECLNQPSVEIILKDTAAWVRSMRNLLGQGG